MYSIFYFLISKKSSAYPQKMLLQKDGNSTFLTSHHPQRFRCAFCSFQFDTIAWLGAHLRELGQNDPNGHGQSRFSCQFCDFPSFSVNEFADHLDQCHSQLNTIAGGNWPPPSSSIDEQPSFSSSLPIDPHRPLYACQFCNRNFPKIVDWRRHERTHTGERPFGCPQCQCRFKLKQTMETHLRTHRPVENGDEQFKCAVCSKFFLSRSALKLHLRIHTNETPFKCLQPGCAIAFRTRKLMMTHHRNLHQNIATEDGGTQEEHFDDFNERKEKEIAIDGLLGLNPRIGGPKSRANLNRSENSAFIKFERNGTTSGGEQPNMGPFQTNDGHAQPLVYCNSAGQLEQSMAQAEMQSSGQQGPGGGGRSSTDERNWILPKHQQQMLVHPSFSNTDHRDHQQQHCSLEQQSNGNFNNGGGLFMRLQHQLPSQMAPSSSYFLTADAEYTREGQVHGRNHQPSSQHFRTLTPTFAYYFNEQTPSPSAAAAFLQQPCLPMRDCQRQQQHNGVGKYLEDR